MAQSENLLPFVLGVHRAPMALPALRAAGGTWSILDEAEIRRQGFTQTARRFAAINQRLKTVGKGKSLQQRIDERGKLSKQVFGMSGYLILAGAGGKIICAACVPVAQAQDLVVDQTLYWKVVTDADEAWYQVGMLNSEALTNATLAFNPKGDFGERHLHTLPYRMMPTYDAAKVDHQKIAVLAKEIATLADDHCTTDLYLADPAKALTARRRKLRTLLEASPLLAQLETLAQSALTGASPRHPAAAVAGRRLRYADRPERRRTGALAQCSRRYGRGGGHRYPRRFRIRHARRRKHIAVCRRKCRGAGRIRGDAQNPCDIL
jgi:hypothetical protein